MTSRRRILAGLTLLPAAAILPRAVFAQSAPGAFAPGDAPFRLVRRVERELRAGARLVVERSWMVRFRPQAQGYRAEGRQVDVLVDAPPELAFLAGMERDRVEEDMFPLLLGADGGIMGQSAAPADETLAHAIEAVREKIGKRLGEGDDRATAERFLNQLQRAGEQALGGWPAILFAPGHLDRVEQREVPLPDGRIGAVSIQTLATSDPATGLMQLFERRIETRLGDSAKAGLERFTLAPQT